MSEPTEAQDRNMLKWLKSEVRHAERKEADYESYGSGAAATRVGGKAGRLRREIAELERKLAAAPPSGGQEETE